MQQEEPNKYVKEQPLLQERIFRQMTSWDNKTPILSFLFD